MRKLLAFIVVAVSCLTFVGQSIASVSESYNDCCLHGCDGMMQCANVACHACATLLAAPPQEAMQRDMQIDLAWRALEVSPRKGPVEKPWDPPD